MGEENETSYFEWTYKFYLRRGGVKLRLFEDGAYNKNFPPELRVFSKRFNHDRNLLRALSSKIKSKENSNNNSNENSKINY